MDDRTRAGRALIEQAAVALKNGQQVHVVLSAHSAGLQVSEVSIADGVDEPVARLVLDSNNGIVWHVALHAVVAVTVRDLG